MSFKQTFIIKQINEKFSFFKVTGFKYEVKFNTLPSGNQTLMFSFRKENISVILFFHEYNSETKEINQFYGYISNNANLDIQLQKFILKKFSPVDLNKLSLNYYLGTDEDKINGCIGFLYQVLTHQELLKVYDGNYWSDAYYVPLWEGTNR